MTTGKTIIDEFLRTSWDSKPHGKVRELILGDPSAALPFALDALERIPKGANFVNEVLGFISREEAATLLAQAFDALERDPSLEIAQGYVARLTLQFPELLQPHLDAAWRLRPNETAYFAAWPWRGATTSDVEALREKTDDSNFAQRCILETRRPELVVAAAKALGGAQVDWRGYLHEVGLEAVGEELRSLHGVSPLHLLFPYDYLEDEERPPWLEPWHPTWFEDAGTTVARVPFGGALEGECAFCSGRLHRLLELPATYDRIPFAPVTLSTCLACLGWEDDRLFYEHDSDGTPTSIPIDGRRHRPEFPSEPLREVEVALVDMGPRWRTQDWAISSKENLHRLGGPPCWVQSADFPKCPKCEQTMVFIAQLDSELPTTDGGHFLWGSGGLCYVFACGGCRTTGLLWQCT